MSGKVGTDYDNDGRTNLALTGVGGWASIPVAFSVGDGRFSITNSGVTEFPTWSATRGALVVSPQENAPR